MTIRLGVSAYLLGQPVRCDAGRKLDHFLAGELGRFASEYPLSPSRTCT
jgi:hypothetical protein